MPIARFHHDQTAVLVVDVQEKLVPHMHNAGPLVSQVDRLLAGANALKVPVLVTEQYRKGLGPTVTDLSEGVSKAICRHDKLKFSACIEPVRDELVRLRVRSVVVCGVEAHVCVLQTCLDLAEVGFLTGVAVDAIGSRKALDQNVAVMRMTQAGIVPTTVESLLLELVGEAGGSRFKAVLPVVK